MNEKKKPQYPKIYPEIQDRLEKVVRELYSINYHGHDGKMIDALLILEDILNQDKKDYPNYPDCLHCPHGHYCDGPLLVRSAVLTIGIVSLMLMRRRSLHDF